MKHNPRLNEKWRACRLRRIHPLSAGTAARCELIHRCRTGCCELTACSAVALPPEAGAHGELPAACMAIKAGRSPRAARERSIVLVSRVRAMAKPTRLNRRSAWLQVEAVPALRWHVDPKKVKKKHTVRRRRSDHAHQSEKHLWAPVSTRCLGYLRGGSAAVAYFYADGANFNAIVGRVRPTGGLFSCVDAKCHINLHKTFSRRRIGGGGPGAGPFVLSESSRAVVCRAVHVLEKEGPPVFVSRRTLSLVIASRSTHVAPLTVSMGMFGSRYLYICPFADGSGRRAKRCGGRRALPRARESRALDEQIERGFALRLSSLDHIRAMHEQR